MSGPRLSETGEIRALGLPVEELKDASATLAVVVIDVLREYKSTGVKLPEDLELGAARAVTERMREPHRELARASRDLGYAQGFRAGMGLLEHWVGRAFQAARRMKPAGGVPDWTRLRAGLWSEVGNASADAIRRLAAAAGVELAAEPPEAIDPANPDDPSQRDTPVTTPPKGDEKT